MAIKNGTNGNDNITAAVGGDSIYGFLGNDTLIGLAGNDFLSGDEGNDSLTGATGNDTLSGGIGADTLIGSVGSDTYLINDFVDQIVELAGEGTDVATTKLTVFDLSKFNASLEVLSYQGSSGFNGTGNDLDNKMIGNVGNDTLFGGLGSDTLDGVAGTDKLIGGMGDDKYYIYNGSEIIVENLSEGVDTVVLWSNVLTFNLANTTANGGSNSNIENLHYHGVANFIGTGNSLNNQLTGEGGEDTLIGGLGDDTLVGVIGKDKLIGGEGNDSYYVNDTLASIVELANEGVDTFATLMTAYSLANNNINGGSNANIENLLYRGRLAFNGTGNTLDNFIKSNDQNDSLSGGFGNDTLDGGAGVDLMVGGVGDDVYVVDSNSDIIQELANQGNDTIKTSLSFYALDGNASVGGVASTILNTVENLTYTGSSSFVGLGSGLNNQLQGGQASNVLSGFAGNDTLIGGAGVDTLSGGQGSDMFMFNDKSYADVITDFEHGVDKIMLDHAVFSALSVGAVSSVNLHIGSGVPNGLDANDFLYYDSVSGGLYYDADGSGAMAASQIVQLNGHPSLSGTDPVSLISDIVVI